MSDGVNYEVTRSACATQASHAQQQTGFSRTRKLGCGHRWQCDGRKPSFPLLLMAMGIEMHLCVVPAQLFQLLLPELWHRVHCVCQVAPDVAVAFPPPLLPVHETNAEAWPRG
jgi:hypothetical protein